MPMPCPTNPLTKTANNFNEGLLLRYDDETSLVASKLSRLYEKTRYPLQKFQPPEEKIVEARNVPDNTNLPIRKGEHTTVQRVNQNPQRNAVYTITWKDSEE